MDPTDREAVVRFLQHHARMAEYIADTTPDPFDAEQVRRWRRQLQAAIRALQETPPCRR